MDDDVEAVLVGYLRDNFVPRGVAISIGRHDNLFEHAILDSAGLLTCLAFLEERFGMSIPDADLLPENFSTVAATVAYVRSHSPLYAVPSAAASGDAP
jgi:acyl carrier protein